MWIYLHSICYYIWRIYSEIIAALNLNSTSYNNNKILIEGWIMNPPPPPPNNIKRGESREMRVVLALWISSLSLPSNPLWQTLVSKLSPVFQIMALRVGPPLEIIQLIKTQPHTRTHTHANPFFLYIPHFESSWNLPESKRWSKVSPLYRFLKGL